MKNAIFPSNNVIGHIIRSFEIANKINNKVSRFFY